MKGIRILFALLLLSLVATFYGCGFIIDIQDIEGEQNVDHTCAFGDWSVVYEPSCMREGLNQRSCSICHQSETVTVARLDHTVATDPAAEGTDTTPQKTEGKYCTLCGTVIVRAQYIYSDEYCTPSRYSGDYAYEYLLSNYENGDDLQSFYRLMDESVEYFHSSSMDALEKEISGNTVYYAAELDFSQFDLTEDEAAAVWAAYRYDHPLYYWISNSISCLPDKLSIIVYDEYVDADIRIEYNSQLYERVEEYIIGLDGKGSEYQIALSFHDGIILSADYAYKDDGVTPEDGAFAHNVLGVMLEGEGVCESYAKAFQLLLNYCNLDNIIVSGFAEVNHSWNLVKMDDGEWYWFDLTWDDVPDRVMGVRHSYFCVNDTDNVKIFDGAAVDYGSFLEDHDPLDPVDLGIEFAYALPERSESSFDYDGVMLRRDVMTLDGLSYVLCGSDKCALIDISSTGDVLIPESISYMDFTYEVVLIGQFKDGMIGSGSVIKAEGKNYTTPKIDSVTIPKTVRLIWDYAFLNGKTVKKYVVDSDSEYFSSHNGVLFTKNLYTLIQYPLAASDKTYTVPEKTVEIAFGAFGDGGNVFYARELEGLYIGAGAEVIGATHFGRGYRDSLPSDISQITTIGDYSEALTKMYGNVFQ